MRPLALYLLAALVLGGCGPTEVEAGQAVLAMAPLITLIGALIAAGYAWLWRPLIAELRFDKGLSARLIIIQLVLCLGIPLVGGGDEDWLFAALCFVGSSYLSLQCLALRLGLTRKLRAHYSALSLAPWILLYAPALWLGYFGSQTTEADGLGVALWILPGYLGLITTPLVVILLVEVLVRRQRLARRLAEESLPRPLPVARAL